VRKSGKKLIRDVEYAMGTFQRTVSIAQSKAVVAERAEMMEMVLSTDFVILSIPLESLDARI
jgi:hypothetical protein